MRIGQSECVLEDSATQQLLVYCAAFMHVCVCMRGVCVFHTDYSQAYQQQATAASALTQPQPAAATAAYPGYQSAYQMAATSAASSVPSYAATSGSGYGQQQQQGGYLTYGAASVADMTAYASSQSTMATTTTTTQVYTCTL